MAIKAGRVGVDPSQVTLSGYIKGGGVSPEVLTKEEARRIYQTIMGMSEYLKKVDANSLYQKISDMVNYQAKLVSGQNIKRINGEDILGSGNITVLTRTLADGIYQTISGMSEYALKSEIPDMDDVLTVYDVPGYDDILTKTRAQQLYTYTAGDGIDVTNNIISNVILDASRKRAVRDIDLNDMTTAGIYYVIASDTTAAENCHYPSGINGLLIVARTSGTIIRQFFFRVGSVGNNEQYWYSREASSTNFGEWMIIYNSKTLTAGNGIQISSSGAVSNYYPTYNQLDLNDLDKLFIGYAYSCTNRPSNSSISGTIISIVSSGRRSQLYMDLYSNKIWYRRYYGNEWHSWDSVDGIYHVGDSVTLNNWEECSGMTSANGQRVYFSIPLGKSTSVDVSGVSFTSLKVIIKGVNGTILTNSELIGSSYSLSIRIGEFGSINIYVDGFTGIPANTPVNVELETGTRFVFS